MKRYLAIDIGASSGRHIVGWMENGELKTEEVYRFPNGVKEQDGAAMSLGNVSSFLNIYIEKDLKA